MALRQIVHLPEPVLRRKAKPVTTFDRDLQTLIDDMIETMREAPGVGLAAPQIDLPMQLAVVEYVEGEDEEENEDAPAKPKKLYVLINPEITRVSDEKVIGVEGCLSIPGLIGEVERHEAIQVKALNRHGSPVKLKVDGWMARIFQHEIDHLNGVLFTDKAIRVWKPYTEHGNKLRFCRMKFLTPSRKGAKEKPLNLCDFVTLR
ncbi:MAG: peptide deformylase [Chloroflexi bacterium]|nr:peptide deformylase [Chloroflexota bacterium]